MKTNNRLAFIDGIQHLHGYLHKVPFSAIITTDSVEGNASGYVFSNPRLLTKNGFETLADKKICSELRESIKSHTLLTPLICRWVERNGEKHPQLVGGDRRYRALHYLISKKENVLEPCSNGDASENRMVSAHIAYEFIPCQIFDCSSDLEAAVLSWAENKNRIDLTEGHEISAVAELRRFDVDDEQILKTLQKDSKWLKETDDLISCLDEETLNLVCENRIKRHAAIKISQIESEETRNEVIKSALCKADDLFEKKSEKMEKQLHAIVKKKDRAKTIKAIAEIQGDEKSVKKAKKVLSRSEEREKAILKNKAKAPVASLRIVEEAMSESGAYVSKKMGSPKTIKKVLRCIQSIIEADGEIEFENEVFTIEVTMLELMKMILENHAIENSEDFSTTLIDWREKMAFASKDEDEDEDEDEDDDEDEDEDEDGDEDEDEDGDDEAESESESETEDEDEDEDDDGDEDEDEEDDDDDDE